MRFSTMFGRTWREIPSEAETESHRLSLRAALVRQIAAGIYAYLPLGWRVLRKITQIMREEMDAVDGQEISMPVVQPAELWRASGRYDAPAPGPALLRFKDRGDHDMVLGMTHEEVVTALARQEINSYRQLPLMVYQIQTKFRDEPRARGGLIRVREFVMKDGYSFHADTNSLDTYFERIHQAYLNVFARCGVQVFAVEADSGIFGGSQSYEFMVLSSIGEDTLVTCAACGYAANAEKATFVKGEAAKGDLLPIEKVATPGASTIQAVAAMVGVPTRQTLKAVFMSDLEGQVIFALIRGDLEVNMTKLSNALGGVELHASTTDELKAAGIVPGFASPVGVQNVRVIADESITTGTNFVAGANEPGFHLKNVNYPRDFTAEQVTDIALAQDDDPCPNCGQPLRTSRGIEAGHIFKLGTKYSSAMEATFLDSDGTAKPLVMGCYGMGTGRLLACIIEQNYDERGIIWPTSVAPFQVHLVSLGTNNPQVVEAAEVLYQELLDGGFDVLYDDRAESAGVKFKDADLIGIPVRITISKRTIEANSVECKLRRGESVELVERAQLAGWIRQALA